MVRKFTSLYKDDPIAEELAAGIQGTDVYQGSPYALGNVPGFEGMQYATPDYNKYADLYNLYLGGGFDAAQDDFVTPGPAAPIGGGGGGSNVVNQLGTTDTSLTGFEQNLLDQGVGVQGAPGDPVVAPGEMPVTQAEMDAFNQIPVNTEYKSPYATGDANIAEQIAAEDRIAKARADEQAAINREQYMTGEYTPTETYAGGDIQLKDTGAGIDDMYATDWQGEQPQTPFEDPQFLHALNLQTQKLKDSGYKGEKSLLDKALEYLPAGDFDKEWATRLAKKDEDDLMDYNEHYDMVSPITKQPTTFGTPVDVEQGFTGDFSVTGAPGVDPMEKMDFVSGADAADPKTLLDKLGLSQLNPAETAVKAAFNMAIGKPVSVLFDLLRGLLPEMDPRQKALREFYNIDDIGRVAEGELMAGYNPVYGGFPGISDPTYGLQDAYQKRIDTIEETLAKQEADPDKTQSQDLIDRLAELKAAKAKEKDILDLYSGDIDERDQMLEDIMAQEKATTEIEPTRLRHLTGDLDLDKQATIPLEDPLITTEDLGRTYKPTGKTVKGEEIQKGPIWIPEREEQALQDELAVEQIADIADRQPEVIEQKKNELADIYDRKVERKEPGFKDDPNITSKVNKAKKVLDEMPQMLGDVGGSRDAPPPSAPTRTVSRTDTDYGQFGRRQEATSAGGGNDGGGGGKIVCTMMNESYGFGSFRNKIWLKQSKNLAPEYQKGYHKLFLPLVKYAKQDGITNRIVKKVLEHIAVHRTIDIRQEARGKRHLLGRIYRRILEPICYWAGK